MRNDRVDSRIEQIPPNSNSTLNKTMKIKSILFSAVALALVVTAYPRYVAVISLARGGGTYLHANPTAAPMNALY